MMASQPLSGLLRLMHGHDPVCELADAELLSRFHAEREQRAFTELVRRHGPMVIGVCRRVVGGNADADDAFQAVFVVLARRAGEIQKPELLGHWLYSVAYRIARKARRITARKRSRETPLTTVPEPIEPFRETDSDLAPILDDELARLPEWYRTPIVLCDLHGLSRNETATRLGIPEGTLSSRLAKGRKKLADRLTRRGITLAVLTSFFSDQLRADLPLPLIDSTVQSAIVVVMGGPLSATITQLASEGVFTMRKLFVVVLSLSITSIGVVWATQKVDDPKTPPVAKAAIKKDEPKAEQPAKPTVTWSKPRMMSYYDLAGPPEKLLWGASEKNPYLFVECSRPPGGTTRPAALDNIVTVFRPRDEKPVTTTVLLTNHHLADVYKNESAFASVRFDVGGINSLRELRYFVSQTGFDDLNDGRGPPKDGMSKKQQMYTRNEFTPRLALNEATKQANAYSTPLDSDCDQLFQLTRDGKAIWNVYKEVNEQGEQVRYGLRLIDPVTSKVLKKLPSVPCGRNWVDCQFDQTGQYAVSITREFKEDRNELADVSSTVTCWDLTKGVVLWSVTPPKDLIATGVAIAPGGKTVAIAYQILNIRRQLSTRRNDFDPNARRKLDAQRVEDTNKEIDKALEPLPEPRVHFHETASGKQRGEITFDRRTHDLSVQLSPHAELLLLHSTAVNVVNPSSIRYYHRTQVYDVASRKLVQTWNEANAKFAFSPKNDGDYPILAIAEDVTKRGDQPNTVPDRTGRLGLWRFESSLIEEKK